MTRRAQYELVLDNLTSPMSQLVRLGNTVFEASREMAKPSAERAAPYRDAALADDEEGVGRGPSPTTTSRPRSCSWRRS